MRCADLTNQTFDRLRVVAFAGVGPHQRTMWLAKCVCGSEVTVRGSSLRNRTTRSCGCLARDIARAAGSRTRTHGLSGTSTYSIWDTMVQRCHNEKSKDYPRYGARGIEVCERWRKFDNFLADMGERPSGLTLDRIDGSKGYSPDNCRWASYAVQVRNSSAATMVTINGKTQCLADWRKEIGLSSSAYGTRIQRGWSVERALTTPPNQAFNKNKGKA